MDIIKNPVVLGVVGGGIAYFYMQHSLDEKNKIRVKKGKKPEELNLLIPLAIAFIIWIATYMYFNSAENSLPQNIIEQAPVHRQDVFNQIPAQTIQMPLPINVAPPYRFVDDVKSSPINLDIGDYNGYEVIDHTKLNSLKSDFIDV